MTMTWRYARGGTGLNKLADRGPPQRVDQTYISKLHGRVGLEGWLDGGREGSRGGGCGNGRGDERGEERGVDEKGGDGSGEGRGRLDEKGGDGIGHEQRRRRRGVGGRSIGNGGRSSCRLAKEILAKEIGGRRRLSWNGIGNGRDESLPSRRTELGGLLGGTLSGDVAVLVRHIKTCGF